METPAPKKQALAVGLDPRALELIQSVVSADALVSVPDQKAFEQFMENPPQMTVALVVCGSSLEGLPASELAQSMKMTFPSLAVYYLSAKRDGYDHKMLVKNGFMDAFLLPLDIEVARRKLIDSWAEATGVAVYKSVKIVDLQPNETLGFDMHLFLPANRKYIKYIAADDAINETQYKKLAGSNVNSVFVRQHEISKFYEFTAKQLAKIAKSASDPTISETEKKEKMKSSVRAIFTNIFSTSVESANFTEGKAIVEQAGAIVKEFVHGSGNSDLYKKIMTQIGEQTDTYSHSTNVSTFAALFSMGAGIGTPDQLAIAGLLHDLGEMEIPLEILEKQETQRDAAEKALYQEHPRHSIKIIKDRRLIVADAVQKLIIQHHERFNGTGFPEGLRGPQVSPETQILGIADEFDQLTRYQEGKKTMTPIEALRSLQQQMIFDPEVLKKIIALFPPEIATAAAA